LGKWRLEAAARCHRGALRPNNEDNFYLNGRWLSLAAMPHGGRMLGDSAAPFQLYAVCDGLGGEAAGELASHEAAQALGTWQATGHGGLTEAALVRAVRAVSDQVACLRPGSGQRSGTTLAALLWQGGHLRAFNVGDSRVYRLRAGVLALLTRDHSEVQQMVERGLITPYEARLSPRRHRITQYLGMPVGSTEVRPYIGPPALAQAGDVYLLCTDGLTDMVEDGDIRGVLLRARTPAEAADTLVQHALDAGGHDNVTALCVLVHGARGAGLRVRLARWRARLRGGNA
jgi:protein phosphatase